MVGLELSRYFPEFSIGYVRQKISPSHGLNAWMIGVSFPVLFFPQHSRVKQARINSMIGTIEAEDMTWQLSGKVAELHSLLMQQRESIRYYETGALPEANILIKNAFIQFYEHETDITQLVQSMNTAREIKRGYIETIYQYNIAALEFELYTN